jgi:hypothetical protein
LVESTVTSEVPLGRPNIVTVPEYVTHRRGGCFRSTFEAQQGIEGSTGEGPLALDTFFLCED